MTRDVSEVKQIMSLLGIPSSKLVQPPSSKFDIEDHKMNDDEKGNFFSLGQPSSLKVPRRTQGFCTWDNFNSLSPTRVVLMDSCSSVISVSHKLRSSGHSIGSKISGKNLNIEQPERSSSLRDFYLQISKLVKVFKI